MFGRKQKVETPCFGVLAQFATGERLMEAIKTAKSSGYSKMEAYTPLPMHEVRGGSNDSSSKASRHSRR